MPKATTYTSTSTAPTCSQCGGTFRNTTCENVLAIMRRRGRRTHTTRQADFYRSDDYDKSSRIVLYSIDQKHGVVVLRCTTLYNSSTHKLCSSMSGAFFIREDKTHTSTHTIVYYSTSGDLANAGLHTA